MKNPDGSDILLSLDKKMPIYIRASVNDDVMLYEPKDFTGKSGGKTKSAILSTGGAWQFSLIEDTPCLPAQDQGIIKGNRRQLDEKMSPKFIAEFLQSTSAYDGESGMTPEDWITYLLYHLAETNRAIDDDGRLLWLSGAYIPDTHEIPYALWSQSLHHASVGSENSTLELSSYGIRTRVKI